jgi:hypothetical protein
MYVSQTILAGEIGFTRITYDETINMEKENCETTDGQEIVSDEIILLKADIIIDDVVYFTVIDPATNENHMLGISLRYW